MTLLWLPNARRIPGNDGGSFDPSFPWRLVAHTTEGSSIEGAVGAYRQRNSWSHLTVDPARRLMAQHIPFDRAARSLEHPPGTPQTNRACTIQIEIVGFAGKSAGWSDDWLSWLGQTVFAPILDDLMIARTHPRFTDSTNVVRLNRQQWRSLNSVCGHQHVPDQRSGHWDPGPINMTRLLEFSRTSTNPQEAIVAFDLIDIAVCHGLPADAKGRLPFWGVDSEGAVFAFNGAPWHGGLPEVDTTPRTDVVGIEPHGTGYVIVRDDGHQDDEQWVASTYLFGG